MKFNEQKHINTAIKWPIEAEKQTFNYIAMIEIC